MGATYLDIAALGTHLVEFEHADAALVEAELGDDALGLGAVGAVALGEDGYEVLRDELLCCLLGCHLAGVVECGPVGSTGQD